ncbi:hypothetical protein BAUCODRAFT_481270 [Baudoinia panamericana UAMH 10762]|uniref:Myb-like domain-containing protein n=1 Tax=Baudoinia panamericana (strain UAMH 10762) TaxID=717646 RepID=M2NCG2_BAUPA|nr:uncharacterized protein BAUCODRAFT_481270 [Baudoinia panamericana UAMH 10762]EMC96580.1 hypothetical protein BAUCODRAFT_481270 [Baudoinia panamericana UAMH 10762]
MATPRSWNDYEKNELLAEIIKQRSPYPAVLLNVALNVNPQPTWDNLPLPYGRSVNSCRAVFDEMRRNAPVMSVPSTVYGPQTPVSAPLSAPPLGFKRTYQPEQAFIPGREIRPKPIPAASTAAPSTTSEPPPKRKRGRPTKEESQAKAAARAERGEGPSVSVSAPSGPTAPSQSVSHAESSTDLASQADAAGPALPPATRIPISAVLTPTARKTGSSSSSSSGTRRRGRSMRSELGEASGYAQQYESSWGRVSVIPEGTPATTTAMRHREEESPATQQRRPSDDQ